MRTTLQFMLAKFAIAWMFALITINVNRVAIYDLGISAVLITTMIGLYPFFGPLQPLFGAFTSRFPLFGYRRSPYLLLGMLVGSLVFLPLPTVLPAIAAGAGWAVVAGFALFFVFGAMIALMANTFLDLVAECTTEATRGKVLAGTWTGQTASILLWAVIFRLMMPDYSLEAMQRLYAITPPVVMFFGILSVWGLEKRLTPREAAAARNADAARSAASEAAAAPLSASLAVLRNPAARVFFLFIALSFPAIFLQDALQEVFGGEVLGLSVGATTVFQMIFNGAVTVGMGLTGALGARWLGRSGSTAALSMADKQRLAGWGGSGAVISLLLQSTAALLASQLLFNLALGLLGLTVGVFTFAAVTMMSDMTVEGDTARYLGLWSLAQAVGLGSSFLLGGALHSLLIGSGLLSSGLGYAAIFALEAVFMAASLAAVRRADITVLRGTAAQPAFIAVGGRA
jgi:BCD family chlorophyll transporter-like MFS transporter